MRAVARQLTNCHRQLPAIRFIPARPRSVYVVRRGMINQRRIAPHPSARSLARLWRVSRVDDRRKPSRNVVTRLCHAACVPQRSECQLVRFLPLSLPVSQVVYRSGINVLFLRSASMKNSAARRTLRAGFGSIFNDQLSSSVYRINPINRRTKRKLFFHSQLSRRYKLGLHTTRCKDDIIREVRINCYRE